MKRAIKLSYLRQEKMLKEYFYVKFKSTKFPKMKKKEEKKNTVMMLLIIITLKKLTSMKLPHLFACFLE